MTHRSCRTIFALACFAGMARFAAPQREMPPQDNPAPRYAVTVIAPFPYVSDDIALGLNDAGSVAFWRKNGEDSIRAACWRKEGAGAQTTNEKTNEKTTEWRLPNGFRSSIARAVNNKGQAAGWGGSGPNLVDSLATTRALLFDSSGAKVRELGTLGGKNSQAFGLNDSGQIVGAAQKRDGSKRAFVWNRGRMRDLETLPKGKYSAAYGINAAGDIAGVSAFDELNNHAVVWRKGKIFDLGLLPEGKSGCARALNSRGQVVGYASAEDDTHAFLYQNGKMTDLGTLGKEPSNANAINDAGLIVGASAIKGGRRHACLWRDGKPSDLNLLVPAGEWTLREAYKINAGGQIACLGANPNGALFALLLTPVAKQLRFFAEISP